MVIAHLPKSHINKPLRTVRPKGSKKELIKPLAELNKSPTTLTILEIALPNSPKSIKPTKGRAITKPIKRTAPAANKAHFMALLIITTAFKS